LGPWLRPAGGRKKLLPFRLFTIPKQSKTNLIGKKNAAGLFAVKKISEKFRISG